jgi:hypothetical protein
MEDGKNVISCNNELLSAKYGCAKRERFDWLWMFDRVGTTEIPIFAETIEG